MDRVLNWAVPISLRRGLRGEPMWLAAGVLFWLVRRSRRRQQGAVWSALLEPGQGIVISSFDPQHPVTYSEPEE